MHTLNGTLESLLAETGDYAKREEWGALVYTRTPDPRYFRLKDHAVSTVTGAFIALSRRGRADSMLEPGESIA